MIELRFVNACASCQIFLFTLFGSSNMTESPSEFLNSMFTVLCSVRHLSWMDILLLQNTVSDILVLYDQLNSTAALEIRLDIVNNIDSCLFQVIAATNRADILDPALMRSGRLDRKIEFPHPTEEARARILQVCLSEMLSSMTLRVFFSRFYLSYNLLHYQSCRSIQGR